MACMAWGVLAPASSMNASRHDRAAPRASAASPQANSRTRESRYNGPGSITGAPSWRTVRSAGTKAPSTAKSWVPVPRMPRTFQVSSTSTSAAGTNRNFCTRSPLSEIHARAANHDACRQPELKR